MIFIDSIVFIKYNECYVKILLIKFLFLIYVDFNKIFLFLLSSMEITISQISRIYKNHCFINFDFYFLK